jgi:hypothetical protein
MSLPLVLRKNIRDNEAKRDEHLATLQTYFGFSAAPTVEPLPDALWAELDAKVDSSYKGRPGWIVYDAVLGGLAHGLASAFIGGWNQSPTCRDVFGAAWSTKTIRLALDGKPTPGHHVTLDAGVLVIHTSPANIVSNVDVIGSEPSVMETVRLEYNGADYRYQFCLDKGAGKELQEAMDSLSGVMGKTVTYSVPWKVYGPAVGKMDPEFDIRCPDFFKYCMDGLVYYVKAKAADDMVKEALLEKWTTGLITSEVNPAKVQALGRSYNAVDFVNGDLVVFIGQASNAGTVGEDLEERL